MTHMPIKSARRVDVGSACVDIRQSPKTGRTICFKVFFHIFFVTMPGARVD